MKKRTLMCALFFAVTASACANRNSHTLYASSANQGGYAERYPDELASARGRFAEHESRAQQGVAAFSTYPDELVNPNWQDVAGVMERADQAGQSADYAMRLEEGEAVVRFFQEEKPEIDRKVAGAAQYAIKQKNCDVDAYATTANALDKAIEKQLEERLRERNEAHRFIADNEDSLGKQNVEKLQRQADDIAFVSYIAHIGIKQTRERIRQLLAEAADVQKTLDRLTQESQTIQADPARTEGQKRAARARAELAQAAKERVASEKQQAEYVLKQVDDRIKKIENDYKAAFDGLKQRIAQKQAPAQ